MYARVRQPYGGAGTNDPIRRRAAAVHRIEQQLCTLHAASSCHSMLQQQRGMPTLLLAQPFNGARLCKFATGRIFTIYMI